MAGLDRERAAVDPQLRDERALLAVAAGLAALARQLVVHEHVERPAGGPHGPEAIRDADQLVAVPRRIVAHRQQRDRGHAVRDGQDVWLRVGGRSGVRAADGDGLALAAVTAARPAMPATARIAWCRRGLR
jgi:hypothetical protein